MTLPIQSVSLGRTVPVAAPTRSGIFIASHPGGRVVGAVSVPRASVAHKLDVAESLFLVAIDTARGQGFGAGVVGDGLALDDDVEELEADYLIRFDCVVAPMPRGAWIVHATCLGWTSNAVWLEEETER